MLLVFLETKPSAAVLLKSSDWCHTTLEHKLIQRRTWTLSIITLGPSKENGNSPHRAPRTC